LLVHLRSSEPAVVELAKKATRYQSRHGGRVSSSDAAPIPHGGDDDSSAPVTEPATVSAAPGAATVVRETHKYAQTGPRNQPRRPPKSRR
jgi:preprotein translocase subunit SecF